MCLICPTEDRSGRTSPPCTRRSTPPLTAHSRVKSSQRFAALAPDVAIVHAWRSDAEGNAQWDGTSASDVEMAKAARRVIVTCEEVVPREVIVESAHMTKLPGYYVDAVIEVPYGAHPTSHVPAYALDAWQIMEYAAVAGGDDFDQYVEQLRSESEGDYRARVLGGNRGDVLEGARPTSPDLGGLLMSDYEIHELMVDPGCFPGGQ